MRAIETMDDVAEGLAWLGKADRRLKRVIREAGPLTLRRREPGLAGLCHIVVSQQLSVASANAIWGRFAAAFPEMTAEAILAARPPRFQRAGLSAPKIRTLKAVAKAVKAGLDLNALSHEASELAHVQLTEIKGIGPWTADIYLMFCLGHPDIFPVGDLALRNAVADAFALEQPVVPDAIATMAERWSPWRSVAARVFWSRYGLRRARNVVPV